MPPTTDDSHVDSDRAELLERRLAEQVDARVRRSLFKVYAAVGVAVGVVASYAGWDFLQSTKKDIHDLAATQAQHMVDTQVTPAIEHVQKIIGDAEEKLTEISINVGVAENLQRRAMQVVIDVENKLADFSPKAKLLDDFASKVEKLNTDQQKLEASLKDFTEKIVKLNADQQGLDARLQGASATIGSLDSIIKNQTALAQTVDSIRQAVTSLSTSIGSAEGGSWPQRSLLI